MKVFNVEQGSDEWFAVRLGKITGSGVSALLSESRAKTGLSKTALSYAYQIVAERLTGQADNFKGNQYTEWGNLQEARARELYQYETFLFVDEVGFVEKDDWCGCSPDGLVGDDGMIEIKCPASKKFVEIVHTEIIPDEWLAQMQFNMWVCGRKWCDFVLFDPRFTEEKQLYIKRVLSDYGDIVTKVEKFIIELEGIYARTN